MTSHSEPTAKGIAVVLEIIVEAVREGGPLGVPGGTLYAALMAYGCTYSTFEAMMGALVSERKLVKKGQHYFLYDKHECPHCHWGFFSDGILKQHIAEKHSKNQESQP